MTRQPRPGQRNFPLLDPLLGGSSLVVKVHHILGPPIQVGYDEPHARDKVGRNATRLSPPPAGADPGPICYGRKDPAGRPRASELTVTDVNLYLGRILPENFPFVLDRERVSKVLAAVAERSRREGWPLIPDEVAERFLEVINLKMAQAIKEISVARGHDARCYVLCCFGGAGGQHACAVARHLGIRRILIHPLAGVFSALGIGLADTTWEGSAPAPRRPLDAGALEALESDFAGLETEGRRHIESQGVAPGAIRIVRKLDLRHVGTETPLTISRPATGDYRAAFIEAHRHLYGYVREDRPIEVVQCRVEANGRADHEAPVIAGQGGPGPPTEAPRPERIVEVMIGGRARRAPVFQRDSLHPDERISGPAIILESIGTIVVEPDFDARVDEIGHVVLEQCQEIAKAPTQHPARRPGTAPDPIALEVINHLFMSIAEQMGRVLQRTAISTNVKERLDFSCAIFDGEGHLVANAPHIPVHLGAMGDAVRAVMRAHPAMVPGDVFVTNNPYAGGSHLPDITTVTPVFIGTGTGSQTRHDFFSASRAHHADIGGVTPGSITPFSTRLEEEGVVLDRVRLVEAGRFNEALFDRLFALGPYPARNPRDNRADLQAQIAANHREARLLRELTDRYGLETVRAYMGHVRANARRQVEDALGLLPDGEYRFEDRMDDGTPIAVRIQIGGGRAVIDFTGTGPDQAGNLNAPEAVTRSATLYVVRTLVDEPIPLNEGCLEPLEIIIPRPSLLSPAPGRAVVAGNVETSTRVVDALLGALGLAAASQGTINNLGFGDETFGYYETIAGGVGAAEGYHGAAAVHTHMTNTRITDPEILETRHPVRLVRFGVCRDSGGAGLWRGGDGAVRHFRFLAPLEATVLSERRAVAPFGLKGGRAGAKGRNVLIRKGGSQEELPGRVAIHVEPGDELIIETPGGGGWGEERRSGGLWRAIRRRAGSYRLSEAEPAGAARRRWSRMRRPWKREFSMKIAPLILPASITPAR